MKKSKLKYFILGIASVHIFFSCGDKYVLPEDQMIEVLYDIELAQALSQVKHNVYSSQEQKDALFASVLKKHNITKEVLDSSLVWYSDKIDIYRKVRDSVNATLEKKQRYYGELLNRENLRVNSGGSFPPYFYLTPEQPIFRFNFDSLQVIPLRLTTHSDFRFKVLGVSPYVRIKSSLYYHYDDTTFTNVEYINNDSVILKLNILKDKKLIDFAGYIRIDSAKTNYKILFYNYQLNNDSIKSDTAVIQQVNNNAMPLQLRKDELIKK